MIPRVDCLAVKKSDRVSLGFSPSPIAVVFFFGGGPSLSTHMLRMQKKVFFYNKESFFSNNDFLTPSLINEGFSASATFYCENARGSDILSLSRGISYRPDAKW